MVSNFLLPSAGRDLPALEDCRACRRLVAWRESQEHIVPQRFRSWVERHGFWGRPVPTFGDREGWLAIVGLAPAAQGANRTGRMFTGDRSGEFLFAALHRAGLASKPLSEHREDDLRLVGVMITAALRCAPPANRPTADEAARCRAFLAADLAAGRHLRVILALGRLAHDAVIAVLRNARPDASVGARFAHGASRRLPGGIHLVDSYHVSQQNTFTGRLTPAMFDAVLDLSKRLGRRR